jgi:hypothetical protein
MELLIALALVWAGAQWLRAAPEREMPEAAAALASDPPATGSIAVNAQNASPARKAAGDPDGGRVRSLLEALELLGRR